jgi:hypothetical protein
MLLIIVKKQTFTPDSASKHIACFVLGLKAEMLSFQANNINN